MAGNRRLRPVEPHPWNTEFAWANTGVEQFDELGYVLVPELFSAGEVAAALTELDAIEAEVDAFLQTQPDGRFSIAETGASRWHRTAWSAARCCAT